jgi:uncharacterized protein with PIN domain
MSNITLEIKDDLSPLCPHCSVEITKLYAKKVQTPEGGGKIIPYYRHIYFCPNCKKTLGISHTKGIFG